MSFIEKPTQAVAGLMAGMVLILLSYGTQAAVTTEAHLNAAIADIEAHYTPLFEELAAEGDELGQNVPSATEVIIDTKMERVEFELHVPEVTTRLETWKLHIPEVTFKLRKFAWHVPELRMVMKDFGFMKTKVPEIRMVRKEWSTKIPEVTMRLHTWKLHLPEVAMKLRSLSLDLPKAGAAQADVEARAARGDAIGAETEQLAAAMEGEIVAVTRDYLGNLRAEVAEQFDGALVDIDRAIAAAPNDPDIKNDLTDQRAQIVEERAQALGDIDTQLAKIG